jgi:hypothetical protein
MPTSTIATTVRILRVHAERLKTEFPQYSTSALVRVFLNLFFEGKIPEVHPLAQEEMVRAEKASMSATTKRVL